MQLLFVVTDPASTGAGHVVRSTVLSEAAIQLGHAVEWLSPRDNSLANRVAAFRPDWIIIDGPPGTENCLGQLPRGSRPRICLLNGYGRRSEAWADLVIVQGFPWEADLPANFKAGPQYVILRPEAFATRPDAGSQTWFVYGGYLDQLRLRRAFIKTGLPGILVGPLEQSASEYPAHVMAMDPGPMIFSTMSCCGRALVTFGMIVWELLAARFQTIKVVAVFPEAMRFARPLASLGAIELWIGPPDRPGFAGWLRREFTGDLAGLQLNRDAAQLVISHLEEGV